jgi:hypothetical protein
MVVNTIIRIYRSVVVGRTTLVFYAWWWWMVRRPSAHFLCVAGIRHSLPQSPGFFLTKNVVIFTENIVKKRKLPTSWEKNNKKSGLTEEKTENAQLSGKSGVFLSIDWKELTVVC